MEPTDELVIVTLGGETIAESRRSLRVLETSHPPVYYVPFDAVSPGALVPAPAGRRTFCEWKGFAVYWTASAGGCTALDAAWSYPAPSPGFEALTDHVAFYPGRVAGCFVDGEAVLAQPGDFYGGWITSRIQGPLQRRPGDRRLVSAPARSARRDLVFDETSAPGGWEGLPVALARLNLGVPVGAAVRCSVAAGYPAAAPPLPDLVAGAGFLVEGARRSGGRSVVDARRDRTLPDFVGGGMRMLVCGPNPSVVAADAGFGYAGATNRFWSVAVGAGAVSRPRDPLASLAEDGLGMTDLVKRATPNADGLTGAEYQAGAERVRRLVEWLRPGVVLFVGLAGWRAAIDRRAASGPQPSPFGGVPAYVMPSTSGRNARTTPTDLADHLRRALSLAAPG